MSCDRCGSESNPYCECYVNDFQSQIDNLRELIGCLERLSIKHEAKIQALLETTTDLEKSISNINYWKKNQK